MNKLFITDLDGTLLDGSGRVSKKTKEIMNALTDKGVSFAVATARTILSVSNILDGLNITAPCILMNGVCTYDMAEKKYLHCHYIDPEATAEYVEAVSGRTDISPYIYTIKDNELCAYYENMDTEPARSFAEERRKRYGKNFIQVSFKELDPTYAVYFVICGKKDVIEPYYNKLNKIKGLYLAFYRDTYDTSVYYLEMCSDKASKAGGIKYLREHYGFDEIHCFGDNTNDIPMFRESDIKYAVSNAVDELKEIADEIILSNDENGVAVKIKELTE
ncbi:MAG: HAD-IIB family hydrolase [Clostridia bacterium]|nr:HAD-IIB family hydrolase [Clostridia bacterium]